jgi:tetratricopeptide (TPR) repeat protein
MADDCSPSWADNGEIARAQAANLAERRPQHAKLKQAAEAMSQGRAEVAERLIAQFLERHPRDAGALNLLAEVALKRGQKERAELLLKECVARSPNFAAARFNYANTLYNLNRLPLALDEVEVLLAIDPHNVLYLDLKAVVLSIMGRHRDSMLCRQKLADEHPQSPEIWIKYASSLRNIGERDRCVAAFRKAIELRPSCGSAWWSLADLKTFRFSDADVAAMQEQIAAPDLPGVDRTYLHFALGRALGDRQDYAKSFENYARGNALKRLGIDYDSGWLRSHLEKCRKLFTRSFFEARAGTGCRSCEPIFIIGMQRAGSTLVEQILASHSAIEGTAELPDVTLLAEHIGEQIAPSYESEYPGVLAKLDPAALAGLGERYLATTRFHRIEGRPFFIDKMPYNFLHVGLIQLILPNAKIIDVRRHPIACCFSNFISYFELGALFAYRLNELGRAYADYVELMAHFDDVLPGRVHRVVYEQLVRDPEREIRRLLDHVGLPFEERCVRFHENTRAMSSVSSEQVRRPLYTESVDQWRNYEPWLGPLKSALGPVLGAWPEIPSFESHH